MALDRVLCLIIFLDTVTMPNMCHQTLHHPHLSLLHLNLHHQHHLITGLCQWANTLAYPALPLLTMIDKLLIVMTILPDSHSLSSSQFVLTTTKD